MRAGENAMRIIQFLPTLAFGDAVGNDTVALHGALEQMGYETHIYCENLDKRIDKRIADDVKNGMPEMKSDDVIIYHHSTSSELADKLPGYGCRMMMIYHNITPPDFFRGYNQFSYDCASRGLRELALLSDKVDYCMADSEFNRQDLIKAGFECEIGVRPILIPFDDYKKKPDKKIIDRYSDGWTNIVFVGRIVPNKKQEDVIAAFAYYKKNVNPKSRLIFVGNPAGYETYQERLKRYAGAMELEDVIFTGHISFAAILAYYHIADIFLCMSEHEGFCVPLVEAMYFDIPVIAYKSCAVPYTMGGSGIVTDSKDPVEISLLIDRVVNDSSLREELIRGQRRRLEDFSYENVLRIFEKQLGDFLGDSTRTPEKE